MKFGIIAEGWGDFAVLENILLGLGLIETRRDVRPLRPELATDETQRAGMAAEEFSNWTWVKKECLSREKFQEFLVDGNVLAEERKIIVQLDTAECGLTGYEVTRPEKDENYCTVFRQNTIAKISEWLDGQFLDDTFLPSPSKKQKRGCMHFMRRKTRPLTSMQRRLSKNCLPRKASGSRQTMNTSGQAYFPKVSEKSKPKTSRASSVTPASNFSSNPFLLQIHRK